MTHLTFRHRRHRWLVAVALAAIVASAWPLAAGQSRPPAATAATPLAFDRYHAPQEVSSALASIAAANRATAAVHTLGRSPGGLAVEALELGPDVGKPDRRVPAVLVMANMEGTAPIATEGALRLAELVLARPDAYRDLTWFIVPAGNPDALARFFRKPLAADARNGRAVNDDLDDLADEDGPDDLNGDGVISEMRVKDPAGEWMPVEGDPRLMRRADPAKGERGLFRLYPEGLDNDGDGEINEDGPGGANIGVTFPHLFRPFVSTGGRWPGSEDETFGLLRFVFDHPEIAMTVTLGASNFCLVPPEGGRQGSVDTSQIKIPERFAKALGVDPNRVFTMPEVIEFLRPMAPPGFEITESVVASFLGLGAVVNPLEDDLKFYRELSERYKEFLKAAKLDGKRLDPAKAKDGSPELWSYYHLGVPTFSIDFWTLPEPPADSTANSGITADSLEAMTPDAFVALGATKVEAFLKEVGAPPTVKAAMLIEGVKSGKMTPKQMAGMLKQMPKPAPSGAVDPTLKALVAFSDTQLGGKGYLAWTPATHPTLGAVEIGGRVPFADTTPPPAMVKPLIDGQLPWIFTLASKLPRVKVAKTDVVSKGAGLYEVTAWIQNIGALPWPTAMGRRNQQPGPVVVRFEGTGLTHRSGRSRTAIAAIDAGKAEKLTWLVQADAPTSVDLIVESANAWGDRARVTLGGAR